jgi:hypothetical protein
MSSLKKQVKPVSAGLHTSGKPPPAKKDKLSGISGDSYAF